MKIFKLLSLLLLLMSFSAKAADIVDVKHYSRYDNSGLFEVLLQFNIKSGWHIFAPYEQEFGTPLEIRWTHPDQMTVLEESFSPVQRFSFEDFSYDGYKNEAFYKTTLKIDKFPTRALISWQACAEECIPGTTELILFNASEPDFENKLNKIESKFENKAYQQTKKFILILAMAFAGGIILNLMPCIFPVLGIKILSLIKMSKEDRGIEALFYTVGVVISMLGVAAILLVFRTADSTIGWGFHLQSPYFVAGMIILFVFLTLLMLDVVNFNSGILNKLSFLRFANKRVNAFMTGLLAVLIASPCTAPFMGAAIGYALMAPVYYYFPVFLFLGLGYALPFALIAWNPLKFKSFLPKPGRWMNILKKILSIPLALTCIWLVWVLMAQQGILSHGENIEWESYSEKALDQAINQNRPVFINFTAKWCITCLVNKKTALQSDYFVEFAKNRQMLLLQADATNQESEIGEALKRYGRASVPLYVYYDGKSDDYLILPQLLSPAVLKEYLE